MQTLSAQIPKKSDWTKLNDTYRKSASYTRDYCASTLFINIF